MVKEKNIKLNKKDQNIAEEQINDESLDKFDEETDGKSSFTLILKFLKTFKIRIGSNVNSIPIPVVFIPAKTSLSYFSDGVLYNFDLLLQANKINNSLERQFQAFRFLLSTLYHVSTLLKPVNSVLGETLFNNFHVKMDDGETETENYCICEQISHHPPELVATVYNKKYGVKAILNYSLNMLFMGSYIKIEILGKATVIFEKFNEIYYSTSPALCGRFIRGFSEYCGESELTSRNSKIKMITNYIAKPLIGGDYDKVETQVIDTETNENIYNISGSWSNQIKIKDLKTNESKPFYKRLKESSVVQRNDDTSLETDSSNVWKGLFDAHHQGNSKLKSIEKRKVEKNQRQLAEERKKNNIQWVPKHFYKNESIDTWDLINY